MKKVKVMWNGKRLKDVYPHASGWQVFKYKVGKFFRKVLTLSIIIGAIYLTYLAVVKFNNVDDQTNSNPVVQKTTENELDKIMNEENFRKVTILRARKVASDSKMIQENAKHEDIVKTEKARHDSILSQIEAENEAIRAEELSLVGTMSLK